MPRIYPTLIILTMLCATSAQAKLYKWVDENGQVHYTDKVPTKYLTKERKVLDEQGTTVRNIQRAKTEEEKAELRRQQKENKEKEKIRLERERRDRILTDTYTTERDLLAAKNARLEAIESQINLAESIIKDSQKKVENTDKYIKQWKSQGKVVPATSYAKLEREKMQLQTQQEAVEKHRQKREEIVEQFDGYIARFRELMEAREKRKAAAAE